MARTPNQMKPSIKNHAQAAGKIISTKLNDLTAVLGLKVDANYGINNDDYNIAEVDS